VAKTELGTKRVCPVTGRKFYDLGKSPVISPYTGEVVPIVVPPQSRSRPSDARAAAAATPAAEEVLPETADAEFVSLEDAEAEATGGKKPAADAVEGDDDVEIDETLDDAAFIEETEEEDADVTDIIGDVADEEET
jgi:uncharacterized protein (TIGR02300 family)